MIPLEHRLHLGEEPEAAVLPEPLDEWDEDVARCVVIADRMRCDPGQVHRRQVVRCPLSTR